MILLLALVPFCIPIAFTTAAATVSIVCCCSSAALLLGRPETEAIRTAVRGLKRRRDTLEKLLGQGCSLLPSDLLSIASSDSCIWFQFAAHLQGCSFCSCVLCLAHTRTIATLFPAPGGCTRHLEFYGWLQFST